MVPDASIINGCRQINQSDWLCVLIAAVLSFIFTNALSGMDSYFKGRVPNKSPSWPKPIKAKETLVLLKS